MKDMLTMGIESTLNNFRVYEYYKIDDAVNDMKTIIQKHCILKSGFEKRIDELLSDNRRVLQNLIESGHFKQEDSSAIVRLTSKIDAYVGIKEMLK